MREALRIGPYEIDDASPALVIGEIGNNHGGSIREAHRLIDLCGDAGADGVKLQRRTIDALYTPEYLARDYRDGRTYGEHRRALELPETAWRELREHAKDRGLLFGVTPFDLPAVEMVGGLEVDFVKAAAAFVRSRPLLEAMYGLGGPVVVSIPGSMPTWETECLRQDWTRTAWLATTSAYPTPDLGTNLWRIQELRDLNRVPVVGFSNHNPYGPIIPAAAYLLGARIIEVHVTRDRSQSGTDHAMSLEAGGVRKLVSYLGRLHDAMQAVDVRELERPALHKMSHGLYAAKDLPAGRIIEPGDVEMRSPAAALFPDDIHRLLGSVLPQEVLQYAALDAPPVHPEDPPADTHTSVGDRDDHR